MTTLLEIETAAETLPEPRLFSKDQIQGWISEDEDDMRRLQRGA